MLPVLNTELSEAFARVRGKPWLTPRNCGGWIKRTLRLRTSGMSRPPIGTWLSQDINHAIWSLGGPDHSEHGLSRVPLARLETSPPRSTLQQEGASTGEKLGQMSALLLSHGCCAKNEPKPASEPGKKQEAGWDPQEHSARILSPRPQITTCSRNWDIF